MCAACPFVVCGHPGSSPAHSPRAPAGARPGARSCFPREWSLHARSYTNLPCARPSGRRRHPERLETSLLVGAPVFRAQGLRATPGLGDRKDRNGPARTAAGPRARAYAPDGTSSRWRLPIPDSLILPSPGRDCPRRRCRRRTQPRSPPRGPVIRSVALAGGCAGPMSSPPDTQRRGGAERPRARRIIAGRGRTRRMTQGSSRRARDRARAERTNSASRCTSSDAVCCAAGDSRRFWRCDHRRGRHGTPRRTKGRPERAGPSSRLGSEAQPGAVRATESSEQWPGPMSPSL